MSRASRSPPAPPEHSACVPGCSTRAHSCRRAAGAKPVQPGLFLFYLFSIQSRGCPKCKTQSGFLLYFDLLRFMNAFNLIPTRYLIEDGFIHALSAHFIR